MLVEIGRLRKAGQRQTFAAQRRQQKHLGVAALDVGDEQRAQPRSVDWLGEDQIAGSEIDADVVLSEVEVDDAIAFRGIEPNALDLAARVGGRGLAKGRRAAEGDREREAAHG